MLFIFEGKPQGIIPVLVNEGKGLLVLQHILINHGQVARPPETAQVLAKLIVDWKEKLSLLHRFKGHTKRQAAEASGANPILGLSSRLAYS